ncbi:galactokinase [Demequina iriomotensis]|uniref:galactokinase n=1 Tax=Demequina iriomotensis TaxID=1536641 RepID=UPI00147060C2|nr:galactokinase family protein [Demequina iriomotensis]
MTAVPPEDTPRWLEPWSLDEGADRARALFADAFEGEPEAIASAPGRLTIVGDHTDYSGGLTLATVTAHRTFVAARRRDDQAIRVVATRSELVDGPGPRWEGALDALEPGHPGWPSRVAGVLWALAERGYPITGVDLAIDSCVPLGTGLGSSVALGAAVGRAADAVWGLALDTEAGGVELAEACWEAENTYVGFPCGRLDPHTVLRCGDGEAALLDFSEIPPFVTRYPLYFHEYGLRLLLIDTGARREGWRDAYARRSRAAVRAAAVLGLPSLRSLKPHEALARVDALEDTPTRIRARHIVSESMRVRDTIAELSGLGPAHDRFTRIGALMLESHRSLSADYRVSTAELDLAVDSAVAAGALGARMAGAGFGGCVVALVRTGALEQVAERVVADFAAQGYARPAFLQV